MTNTNKTTKALMGAVATAGFLAVTGGVASADENNTYEVKSGDTLNDIAKAEYGKQAAAGLKAIVKENHISDKNAIAVGQKLTVPELKKVKVKTYKVQDGEGLYQIATDKKVSIQNLLYWNDLKIDSVIHPGQTLKISGEDAPEDFDINGDDNSAATQVQTATTSASAQVTTSAPAQSASTDTTSVSSDAALDIIIARESSNNPNARNGIYYGLGQLSPAAQAQYNAGPGSSYAQQYAAAKAYAVARYGSTQAALAFWNANGWY